MRPIKPVTPHSDFPEKVWGGRDYLDLPAVEITYADGSKSTVTRWYLTVWERLRLLFTGSIWWEQMNFGEPLQPVKPRIYEPFTRSERG
jgi:hypothetical protein